jgi:Cof subfamily protein (haloacid dehalogenase superfamily)
MDIKAVVLDLDGTLLNSQHQISDRNKKVILELKNRGVKIFLATGRTYTSLYPYKQELDLDTPVICYNGAKIVDSKTDKTYFEFPIHGDDVKELIKISREKGIHLNLYQDEIWYIEKSDNEETKTYIEISGLDYTEKDFDTFEDYRMTKSLFIAEHERLLEIEGLLNKKLNGSVHVTFSKPFFLEILNGDVNKGTALEKVLETEGIPKENVVAFGDGLNDYEMLDTVGIGVAMGNSLDRLKGLVKLKTLSNDDDGVAVFLERYI